MDETVIRAGFFCELARRDLRVTVSNEQALRRIEERLLVVMPRG